MEESFGLSPRSPRTPRSSSSRPQSAFSSRGGGAGALLDGVKHIDPMLDTRTMADGGLADHPLKNQLSQVYKGLRLLDHDSDGYLAAADIVRGLNLGLAVGVDLHSTVAINDVIRKSMSANGKILYAPFVYALGADRKCTNIIKVKLDEKASRAATAAEAAATKAAQRASRPVGPQLRPGVTADDLRRAQSAIKDKLNDKFSSLTAAFRSMDKDGSGYVSRDELLGMVLNLNLTGIRNEVIDTFIDFVDCENDVEDDDDAGATDIGYREFARAMSADDIMHMQALVSNKKSATPPPPTPPPQNLVAEQVSSIIHTKFKPDQMRQAFEFFDKDKSRSVSRPEVRRILAAWGAPLTDDELNELFTACDTDGNGQIDYQEFCSMIEKRPSLMQARTLVKQPALRPGVRASDMRRCQHVIQEHILTKFKKMQAAFKFIDKDRTGSITRDELKQALYELNLLNNFKPEVIETLMDFIDVDPDSDIEYKEFARVLSADDVMAMAPLSVVPASTQQKVGHGRQKMSDMPGAQGLSWTG